MTLDEDSIHDRVDVVRGSCVQDMRILLFTPQTLKLALRSNLHVPGTTRGTNLGQYCLPQMSSLPAVSSLQEKKEILGASYLEGTNPERGGLDELDLTDESVKQVENLQKDSFPVFYWEFPNQTSQDFCHRVEANSGCCLSLGSGRTAFELIRQRKPVFAVACTEAHGLWVQRLLEDGIWSDMLNPTTCLHDAQLVSMFDKAGIAKPHVVSAVVGEQNQSPSKPGGKRKGAFPAASPPKAKATKTSTTSAPAAKTEEPSQDASDEKKSSASVAGAAGSSAQDATEVQRQSLMDKVKQLIAAAKVEN